MRVFTYVIDHDLGFAPNPFHGSCTLAACKPKIRATARISDYIVGTGSKKNGIAGRLSYWMRVDEILSFDEYWADPRFRRKRPNMAGSMVSRYGDNIYRTDPASCKYVQADSFHSQPDGSVGHDNLERDTGSCGLVLVGWHYCYWGGQGPAIPAELGRFVHVTRAHRCRYTEMEIGALLIWLGGQEDRGAVGEPANWLHA